jgi:hypothetical protein
MPTTIAATNVYLLPPDEVTKALPPLAQACFEQLRAGFAIQSATAHALASDPESAELILAPIQSAGYGPCFEALRSSATYRKHADKLVVYSPDDNQFPALRGLYPAAPRRWVRRGWALPAHYISAHIHQFSFTSEEIGKKDILFSFVGSSRTHAIRERIVRWRHPAAVVIDSSAKNDSQYWWEKTNKNQFVDSFKDVTRRSKFVVCPRGVSSSSIRLYEAMEAAAVPVIVSDDLELPLGPSWEEFSVRVQERDIESIPRLIEQLHDRATKMGSAARRVWETYFSPEATVASVVGWARLLLTHSHRRPTRLQVEEYTDVRLARAKLHHVVRKEMRPNRRRQDVQSRRLKFDETICDKSRWKSGILPDSADGLPACRLKQKFGSCRTGSLTSDGRA